MTLLGLILSSCTVNEATPQWEISEQLSRWSDATVPLNGFAQDAAHYTEEKLSAAHYC